MLSTTSSGHHAKGTAAAHECTHNTLGLAGTVTVCPIDCQSALLSAQFGRMTPKGATSKTHNAPGTPTVVGCPYPPQAPIEATASVMGYSPGLGAPGGPAAGGGGGPGAGSRIGFLSGGGGLQALMAFSAPPPPVTFRRIVVPLRGPGQSPVRPFACCVGSLRSVGRCGRCSCWCRFRVRGAQSLVCRSRAGCGGMCRLRVSSAQ